MTGTAVELDTIIYTLHNVDMYTITKVAQYTFYKTMQTQQPHGL